VHDSLEAVNAKLIRRHPHVFQPDGKIHDSESKERAPTAEAALARWNALKEQEHAESGRGHTTLGGIPASLPALLRAFKIGKRAAEVGFDWVRSQDVLAKIEEEVGELRETLEATAADTDRAEEEMGDLLLAIANLSRKLGIEPEAALRKANDKFITRFATMERSIVDSGRSLREMNIEALEEEWQRLKSRNHEG
jgi:MazG family protein